ncbi:4Fe-4S binding protein, partial [Clostridioides difficile]
MNYSNRVSAMQASPIRKLVPLIDSKCMDCNVCVENCPAKAIHFESIKGYLSTEIGASVSTVHMLKAHPYSSVTNKLFFPINP